MKFKVFLQNAWSPVYAGTRWPRESWLRALARSRSGQRLRLLLDDLTVCENTTREVGPTPNSVCRPDTEHIKAILKLFRPTLIVCCGKQAEAALLPLWPGPLLSVPHPACRVLTDALYQEARTRLDRGHYTRTRLVQRPGRFIEEVIL